MKPNQSRFTHFGRFLSVTFLILGGCCIEDYPVLHVEDVGLENTPVNVRRAFDAGYANADVFQVEHSWFKSRCAGDGSSYLFYLRDGRTVIVDNRGKTPRVGVLQGTVLCEIVARVFGDDDWIDLDRLRIMADGHVLRTEYHFSDKKYYKSVKTLSADRKQEIQKLLKSQEFKDVNGVPTYTFGIDDNMTPDPDHIRDFYQRVVADFNY